ncbi:MAG: hypothetical protein F6K65_00120 [Moorea sp. SIO3C2]|nr:hypothetical protein [Moorena sp. SIO3C2]
MGETTAIASGGNPQDRAASPVPLLHRFLIPHTPHPTTHTPHLRSLLKTYPCEGVRGGCPLPSIYQSVSIQPDII